MEGEQIWFIEEEMEEVEGQFTGGLIDFLMFIRYFYSLDIMNKDNSKFMVIINFYLYLGKVFV